MKFLGPEVLFRIISSSNYREVDMYPFFRIKFGKCINTCESMIQNIALHARIQ